MKFKFKTVASSLVAVLAVGLFAYIYGAATSGKLFMNGSLSSRHEGLENDCAACHEAWEGVKNKACLSCHKGGKHFSDTKAQASAHDGPKAKNFGCPKCHKEHRGRSYNLIFAGARQCSVCHPPGGHAAAGRSKSAKPEDAAILFTHNKHVGYRALKQGSCKVCHKSLGEKDGFTTKDIFKQGCAGCHVMKSHDADTKIDGSCKFCHPGGRIFAPENKTDAALKSYRRPHKKHARLQCAACHEGLTKAGGVPKGGAASPEKCVACHRKNRIDISCVSCHQYHAHIETKTALSRLSI